MVKCSTLSMPVIVYRSYCKYYWGSGLIMIHTYDINGEQICDIQGPYSVALHRKVLSFCNELSSVDGFPVIAEDTPDDFFPYFPATYKEWVEMFGEIEPDKVTYFNSNPLISI